MTTAPKLEPIAKYAGEWTVERRDREDGYISYEVWCLSPYTPLFSISEFDNRAAKALAEQIAADHNRRAAPTAGLREALEAAREKLWDEMHPYWTEEGFRTDPVIQKIDAALTLSKERGDSSSLRADDGAPPKA